MDLICTILIANLCIGEIPGVSKLTVIDHGLSADATLNGPGWTATIHLRDDLPRRLIESKLSTACTDDACVGYFKICASQADAPSCTWNFISTSPWIRIDAETPVAMADAQSRIAVVTPGQGYTNYRIRLAALNQTSSGSTPICRPPAGAGAVVVSLDGEGVPLHYSSDEMRRYYPERALRLAQDGHARVRCQISNQKLGQCSVLSEFPAGFLFGERAVQAAARAQVDPSDKRASLDMEVNFGVTAQARAAFC